MLHLSRYSPNPLAKDDLLSPRTETRQPHHISSLTTPNHRQGGRLNPVRPITSKKGKLKTESEQAVSILRYQLNDHQAKQQHLTNLRSNLEHRLQVAIAMGDQKLIRILQEEFRQLT